MKGRNVLRKKLKKLIEDKFITILNQLW